MCAFVKLSHTANQVLPNKLLESERFARNWRTKAVAFCCTLISTSRIWLSRAALTSYRKRLSIIPLENNRPTVRRSAQPKPELPVPTGNSKRPSAMPHCRESMVVGRALRVRNSVTKCVFLAPVIARKFCNRPLISQHFHRPVTPHDHRSIRSCFLALVPFSLPGVTGARACRPATSVDRLVAATL
jgi:hypothetical protein